ncbi:flagellar hook protein FlgE [Tistlia consotensis]|uniref:Flagellar hook protein FlgE n=1 Tax=Tistlia consotensis USBA 355 TaxID=560819 RepID=A0A1Y6CQ94_9PROT|nr:flagellar hook protein FlgE [Tistlia consotensis]SMF67714.1 flagellar hook protein FlgE [Tistlia consotensis USBA 355]SNR99643.1 flagellar hook protein FlgE [Tistlia consotensis]
MSIYGAMFSGVSGLNAQSRALGMISDNISNVNTVGYKSTQAQFATLVTQSINKDVYTPGGVRAKPAQQLEKQGLLQSSASGTDIAISGNGFFVVNESATPGLGDDYLFTRAGSFTRDASGNLKNTAGYYLQGWQLDSNGNPIGNTSVLSSLKTVNIANLSGTASATTTAQIGANLPSTAAVGDTQDISVQVYDSLGNAHDMTLTFTKAASNSWTYAVNDPVLAGTTTTSGTVTSGGTGSITFDGNGVPTAITAPNIGITWTTGGATNSTIAMDIGTVGEIGGITQFSGQFSLGKIEQNGVRFGEYSGVTISEDGIVTALFDNGETKDIYKIPVAQFSNPDGLGARDGNAYIQTSNSGDVTLTGANSGGAGKIAPGALEASNVDLAEEFTNMIVTQRAYSASAKVITTADQMLDELIRIGR